jgi:hypothetical protein
VGLLQGSGNPQAGAHKPEEKGEKRERKEAKDPPMQDVGDKREHLSGHHEHFPPMIWTFTIEQYQK